jgi:bile acid:Na+ symporter, BASS family
MTIQTVFNIVVIIFTVANLMAGGLACDLKVALKWLRSPRFVLHTLLWSWVVCPALALLITKVLPLSEGHAAGLMLVSLAPIAPFLPIAALKARGDMTFTGAYILLATVVTVVLMPVMAPLLIKGLTLNAWALAKPLIALVLVPLLIGVALKYFKESVADKIFPVVKKTGGLFLLICLAMVIWLYGKQMLETVGSLATAAWVLFMVVMAVLPYLFGFGLKQNQRSVMALGQSSRNISAGFVAFFGITNPPAGMFVMVVLVVPLHVIIGLLAVPPIFARLAGKTAGEGPA